MAFDFSHGVHTPLSFALQQLDGWTAFEERSAGTLTPNPLAEEFCRILDKKPMSLNQRRYLSAIASRTVRDDAFCGSSDRFWHMLRDASAKRLPLLSMRPGDLRPLGDILVFEKIAIANARLMTGIGPGRAPDALPAHYVPSGFRGGLREFFDVMEARFFPHLETLYAAGTQQTVDAVTADIAGRIDAIRAHVHDGMRDDMAGLDVLGPIDPARFAALRHKTKTPTAPAL